MKSIKNLIRASALGLALIGATFMPTKQAHADGGAVVAGIAGGLLLGTIIGSTAHAGHGGYYADPYYAPAPVYSAPSYYYPPAVTYGFSYSSGRHYGGHRHYRGHRHARRHWRRHHRGHWRKHRRHHRRHHW